MPKNIKKKTINDKEEVSYLHRDFESFRAELIRYATTHYSDQIQDFTESSLAGMFVDMAAYVGDVMSYYLDHQFNELSLETAVEDENVERLIRQSGISVVGSSPASVDVSFSITVNSAINSSGNYEPDPEMLCTIKVGTILTSTAGPIFELLNDIDFSEKDKNGNLTADQAILTTDASGNATTYLLTKKAACTSSKIITEKFAINDTHERFRTITLAEPNVSEIISILDDKNDEYYEVESLTQNTIFIRETNNLADNLSVPERLRIIPAPKRFIKITAKTTGRTTLRFGGGKEDVFDEDVIPDPSESAIKLFGDRKSVLFPTINPNDFLTTNTLGISPRNTTLNVKYRAGGGLSHNVSEGTINDIKTLVTDFGSSVSPLKISRVRASLFVNNTSAATGGAEELSLNELRQLAFNAKNLQNRIVTKEDLLVKVYTIPSNFGRVFRAGIRDNPFNPFSSHLHLLSQDSDGKLILSSDSLKENIAIFLKKYRLITDSIDIVDGKIINIGCKITISVMNNHSPENVVTTIKEKLKKYFDVKNFQIDQPIYDVEIKNIILNSGGVINLSDVLITGKSPKENGNIYSGINYSANKYRNKGIYYPLPGGIFEMKFPDDDIEIEVR